MTADARGGEVLIAGGGIGGLTAALCLARVGCAVTVLEQSREFGEVGAGLQLSPNCSRVLHELGLEAPLRAVAFLPQATEMRHWRDGHVIGNTPLGDEVRARYGAPYYHVHRADLLRVLLEAARAQPRIRLHPASRVERIDEPGDRVRVQADGRWFDGDWLLGADGIHSQVREHLFGPQAPRFTGNVAWRAIVPTSRLPAGHVRPVTTAWWGPGRHFVHYYLRRGELVNCVCVVEKEGWELESWTERGDHTELRRDFTGWHPELQVLLDAIDPADCFKWALFDRAPMPAWGRGRVTLLGDACHPTLPFMAQGAAMAIEDAAVLARCVSGGAPLAQALQTYVQARLSRTERIQSGSRRNATLFHLSGIPAWLRDRAMGRAPAHVMDWLYRYDPLTEPLPGG